MSTVTYKSQPGIHKTRGSIPLAGTSHLYTVSKLLWPHEIEKVLIRECLGYVLHICCGKSRIGHIRLDMYEQDVDVKGDASRLPFYDRCFNTTVIDPPYNGKFQWNHGMLSELGRVTRDRFIFQHWFIPVDKYGYFKKDHSFILTKLYNWMPKSYFGRVQVVSIFDRVET